MKRAPAASQRLALAFCLASAAFAIPLDEALPQASRTYEQVPNWAQLPSGTTWQDMMAVDIDARGDIYALQRTPFKVMVFDSKGRFLRSWGEALMLPKVHGFRIDREGNAWITDRKLHQVLKFTRDGRLLMALGTKGVAGDNDSKVALNDPADIAFGPNGEIFVADGESTNTRIVKFSRDGKFLESWGTKGSEPGQLLIPHGIVMDSRGRLFVANRGNKRIEIFDQNGKLLGQIKTKVTPYGLSISRDGIIYVADGTKGSESLSVIDTRNEKILAHIPGLNGSHMLAVDRKGAIYVAEVRGMSLRKFVRK
jgi:DNA-binding beta-propeller fold protein YncE